MTKDGCGLVLLSSTEQGGMHFDLNPAAVHLRFLIANLNQAQCGTLERMLCHDLRNLLRGSC